MATEFNIESTGEGVRMSYEDGLGNFGSIEMTDQEAKKLAGALLRQAEGE